MSPELPSLETTGCPQAQDGEPQARKTDAPRHMEALACERLARIRGAPAHPRHPNASPRNQISHSCGFRFPPVLDNG